MNEHRLTPKPAPSAALHTPVGKTHAGHRHGEHSDNEHSDNKHSDNEHNHKEHSHGEHIHNANSHHSHGHSHHAHSAPTPADSSLARPALLSASPLASVLGWPAWLRVLAVSPVLVLLWLAVAWASAEVAPW